VLAARQVDLVEEIQTGWSVQAAMAPSIDRPDMGQAGPSAALVHWLQQATGTVLQWQDGDLHRAAPLQREQIDYPGVGTRPGWNIGHPESVTLPLRWPSLRRSVNLMTGPADVFDRLTGITRRIDEGQLDARSAARLLVGGGLAQRPDDGDAPSPPLPHLFAVARGTRAGRPLIVAAQVNALPRGGMGAATGVPLALGLALLHEGAVPPGVHTPEQVIDADRFFGRFARYCSPHAGPLITIKEEVR
jgi:hypothetical protein